MLIPKCFVGLYVWYATTYFYEKAFSKDGAARLTKPLGNQKPHFNHKTILIVVVSSTTSKTINHVWSRKRRQRTWKGRRQASPQGPSR